MLKLQSFIIRLKNNGTLFVLSFVLIVVLLINVFCYIPTIQDNISGVSLVEKNTKEIIDSVNQEKKMKELDKKISTTIKSLNKINKERNFLIINTTQNHFRLYKRNEIIQEGLCSTGSYIMLEASENQKWMFKTPRGVFTIKGKTKSPVWRKPDWAFVEEGEKIPPQNSPLRFESGVLGDYALSLGQGYMLHGTLYKRFIGLPVTHGCIRFNDEDLEAVYKTLEFGDRVFIY